MNIVDKDATKDKEEEEKVFYKEAFDAFDWNHNGTIPTRVGRSVIVITITMIDHD